MKSKSIYLDNGRYSPFGSLISWYVGDKLTRKIGIAVDIVCYVFRRDPKVFHRAYPTYR
jgi:hypothetical protein